MRPLYLILLSALLFGACDRNNGGTQPTNTGDGYMQYGEPFAEVPEAEEVVLYEVNPLVFSAHRDLQGVTARLDSIRDLGVNVIWLMPIYEMGIDRSVGSPYCIKDFTSMNAAYGDIDDLRTLVEQAHKRGMAVLLDWVANHTSWDHVWMGDSSFYVRDNGSIIHPPGTNWSDVAELNYDNPELRAEMISAMKYWILEANVDGYRCDYAGGVPNDFWNAAIDTLRAIPGRELLMFAESDQYDLLEEGFDMSFSWSFYGSCWNIWNLEADASQLFQSHLDELTQLPSGKTTVRFMTNHDQHAWDGTPKDIFGSNDAAFGVFLTATTMGGVPLLYNGQEKGLSYQLPFFVPTTKGINWTLNPEETARHKLLLEAYHTYDALRGSANRSDYSTNNVIAFASEGTNHMAFIAVNPRTNPQTISLPQAWQNKTVWNVFEQDSIVIDSSISLHNSQYLLLVK